MLSLADIIKAIRYLASGSVSEHMVVFQYTWQVWKVFQYMYIAGCDNWLMFRQVSNLHSHSCSDQQPVA